MPTFRSSLAPQALVLTLVLAAGVAAAQDAPAPLEALAPQESLVALGWQPAPIPFDALPDAFEALDVEGARAGWEALRGSLDEAGAGSVPGLGRGFGPEPLLRELGDLFGVVPRVLGPALGGDVDAKAEAVEALEMLCPDAGDELEAMLATEPAEALLTVSASASRPLPAGLLLARFEGEGLAAAEGLHDALAGCAQREPMVQDGQEIHVLDTGEVPVALTRSGDAFAVSNDPEALRGVIRRSGNGNEATLADAGVGRALTDLDAGGVRLGVNVRGLADLADDLLPAGMARQPGGEVLRERLLAAARTVGGVALRLAPSDESLVSDTVLAVPEGAPDAELAALLRCEGCPTPGTDAIPGTDPIAASGRALNLPAVVTYLDGWLGDLSDAGAPVPSDLRAWLREEAGVDLDALLLDWVGNEVHTVRLRALSPDVRTWLGGSRQAWSVTVTSEAAARDGLDALEALVREELAENEDLAGQVAIREGRVGDLTFRRVQIGPVQDLRVGVAAGRLLVASGESSYVRIADAARNDRTPANALTALQEDLPEGATRWSYAQPGRDLDGLAETLRAFTQPLASGVAAALRQEDEPAGRAVEAPPAGGPHFGADGFGGEPRASGDFLAGDDAPAALSVPGTVEAELGDDETARVRGDDADLYRLEGVSPGDAVQIEMTSEPVDTYLYWVQPEGGAVLASDDDSPDTSRSALAFEVPESGEVWIAASSFAGFGSGPYTLEASLLDADADVPLMRPEGGGNGGGVAFEPDDIEPEPLSAPGRVEADLADTNATVDGKDAHVYGLQGLEPGAEVAVEMTSDPVDTYLYLLDPSAPAIVGENDDVGGTRRSALSFTAPESGEVWIGASSWGGRDEGPYTVTVTVDGMGPEDAEAPSDEEAEAPAEEASPATFEELLPLMEIGPDALEALAASVGEVRAWSHVEDGFVRHRWTLEVDW